MILSCPFATQDSTCQEYSRKQVATTWQKQTCQDMPQHACQIISGYHLSKVKTQAPNMAAYPLKQNQKLWVQQQKMLKSQMHCSVSLEAFFAPNRPNYIKIPHVNITVG